MTDITLVSPITLVSHDGARARAGYGPTVHPVHSDDEIRPLVTVDDQVRFALHDEHGLLVGRRVADAFGDAHIDGDTIRFDGRVPFDSDGCCQPRLVFAPGWVYTGARGTALGVRVEEHNYGRGRRVVVEALYVSSPGSVLNELTGNRLGMGARTVNRPVRRVASFAELPRLVEAGCAGAEGIEVHSRDLLESVDVATQVGRALDRYRRQMQQVADSHLPMLRRALDGIPAAVELDGFARLGVEVRDAQAWSRVASVHAMFGDVSTLGVS